jgi:undecaprenyl-diphosphatase
MISSALAAATSFVASHPIFAYASVFLLALSECIPFVGAVVPGTAAIVAISALTPTGAVRLWPLLIAATAGAIVGDGLSFWIGHAYRRGLLESWPVNRYPGLLVRSQAFMARHGDKSIFLARFTPGVRAFIPLLAGIFGMPARRFYLANIASAVVWAPSNVVPGVIVGESIDLAGAAAKPLGILLILLIVLAWIMSKTMRLILRCGIPWLLATMEMLRVWARDRESRLKRAVFFLLDPSRPDAAGLALLGVTLVAAAWLFLTTLKKVLTGDRLVSLDDSIYHALQNLRSPPGDAVMVLFSELGDSTVVIGVTGILFVWFVWRRAWRTAFYWLATIAGASALNTAIKVALHRPRPGDSLYEGWSAYSFPSGHSTVNVVLYGFIVFLTCRELRPAGRVPIAMGAGILVLLIAFSRLYLGAHWVSDVIGGLAFGTAWLTAVGFSYFRKRPEPVGPVGLIVVAVVALAVAGTVNVARHHALDVERYAVKTATPTMDAADWRTGKWRLLPAYRIDLTGEPEEPLTIQYAGELDVLREMLLRKGWRAPAPWTPRNTMSWLKPTADITELSVVPHLASGEPPSLTLVLQAPAPADGSRLVLRMWPVDLELLDETHAPVWVGSVLEERFDRPFSLITIGRRQGDVNKPRDALADAIRSGSLAVRSDGATNSDWDGRVLLIRESVLREATNQDR